MTSFAFLKILGQLALPPASLALGLLVAGLLAVLGFRRLSRAAAFVAVAQTIAFSMPLVSDLMMLPLQREARREAQAAAPCCYDSIVVLGGAVVPPMLPDFPDPSLTNASDRVWHAARLFKRGVASRIIVTGGNVLLDEGRPTTTEAEATRRFLTDLGVPREAIVEEGRAINTIQNIRFVRELVTDKKVALVTSAFHMPRALRLARLAGLDVAAFPTDWQGAPEARLGWETWMPSASAQAISGQAMWEYMAWAFDFRVRSLAP
ncbi:MAG: YdcF family protein [Alphaproteobacteria bacterium]|nr:YdcF family protein [Alphaproteobacteria bacterium]